MNALKINQLCLNELRKNVHVDFTKKFNFEEHKKLIFWGVKSLARDKKGLQDIEGRFQLYSFFVQLIEKITPRQLMNLFPITKEYDGYKYEVKDYFYTIEKCKEHGMDKEIGNGFEFLWDYMNFETGLFLINYMGVLSDLRESQGEPGIMEEFAAENGIKTYTMYEINGEKVAVENLTIDKNGRVI